MEHAHYTPEDKILFDARYVQIFGGVDSKLAYRVNKTLLAMAQMDNKKPIYLLINSPGGEVTSGFSIYDTARFLQVPIYTVVTGMAASMGSIISLAAPLKNRLAFPNSKFLIHQPLISGRIQGSASDIEIHAEDIVKTKKKINELYAKETGRSLTEIELATDRDHWLSPEEALEFNLISKIIGGMSDLPK